MTNTTTKRALIASIVSLVLCFSMLLGTTYAWFTDSAVSGRNTIKSGNLDVVLEYKTSVNGTWAPVTENTKLFKEGALYEPGYTEIVFLRVSNAGSLALKYNLNVNVYGETKSTNVDDEPFSLKDYLEIGYYCMDESMGQYLLGTMFGTREAALSNVTTTKISAYDGVICKDQPLPKGDGFSPLLVALVLTMPESVGNEANHKTGVDAPTIDLGISLLATQYTDENDSFDNQYDKDATYPELWDGTVDTTWYNDTDTEFTLDTAEQLAGLAKLVDGGNTFTGKTIKLGADMDFYAEDENGDPISFEPVGSFSDDKAFEGTFDGQGHTISNLYQNGWALENGYWDGPEYGMGLFSLVENATIKNVNFDGASLPTEANIIGVVAGGAVDCVFENINITGAYLGNHSWYSGGFIGWAEGSVTLNNCDIDATSVVSSQWGDFNNANGGLIGGINSASTILLKDCDVACVIDAYNDVTSAYEWYSYRNCGMLIGDTGQKDDPDGNNVGNAIAPNLTCENVTVTYGTWANYHYCEFGSAGYPFCRVEAGESTGAYGNARVGEYTDANGNKVLDDSHVHNDGEKHNELIVFDQLYGGESGDRYCTYGTATHDGVTVIYNNK